MSALPKDPRKRLEVVGRALFGHDWKTATAAGVGVSRAALMKWLSGKNNTPSDLDERLIVLVEYKRAEAEANEVLFAGMIESLKRMVG